MRTALPILILGLLLTAVIIDTYKRAKWAEKIEVELEQLQYSVSQK